MNNPTENQDPSDFFGSFSRIQENLLWKIHESNPEIGPIKAVQQELELEDAEIEYADLLRDGLIDLLQHTGTASVPLVRPRPEYFLRYNLAVFGWDHQIDAAVAFEGNERCLSRPTFRALKGEGIFPEPELMAYAEKLDWPLQRLVAAFVSAELLVVDVQIHRSADSIDAELARQDKAEERYRELKLQQK